MQQFQLPNPSQTSNRPTVSIPSPHPHPSSVHMRSAAMTAAMYADSACRPIRLVIPLSSEKACSAAVCASGRDSPHVSSYAPELACATACDRSRLQRACMRPCIRAPIRAYMHRASIYIYTYTYTRAFHCSRQSARAGEARASLTCAAASAPWPPTQAADPARMTATVGAVARKMRTVGTHTVRTSRSHHGVSCDISEQ